MKAYVLIQADPAKVRSAVDALKGRSVAGARVVSAEAITGPYDILAVCEGPDLESIGRCVMEGCATVEGVQRTMTCLVAYG